MHEAIDVRVYNMKKQQLFAIYNKPTVSYNIFINIYMLL